MRCTTPPETQRVRPLYRREHEARGAQGFLGDEKVELLDGRIVMATEEGGAHAAIVRRLARSPFEAIPANEGEVGVGNPLALDNRSEPEPDLMVVAPAHTYHHAHHTTASLVVEVAQPRHRPQGGALRRRRPARLLGRRPRGRRGRPPPRAR